MSTQLPAHLLALFQQNPEAAAVGSTIIKNDFAKIRYTGSKWKLLKSTGEEVAVPTPHLDVIIVGVNEHKSHTVYAQAFDPKVEPAPPLWSSDDGTPVPAEHENKVVTDYRRLAVLVADNPEGGIFELRVSPASITNADRYISALNKHNTPVVGLVTRITFDRAVDYPKLVFTPAAYIDADQATIVGEALTEGAAIIAAALGKSTPASQLAAPGPVLAIEAPKAEAPRKRKAPSAAAEPEIFTLPVAGKAAAASTVTTPPATDSDIDALLSSIIG